MIHIAIIGAGQAGSRHLQGLGMLGVDFRITVIDPNPNSLELARSRYDQIANARGDSSVTYKESMIDLRGPIDVTIIATNSDVRRGVIEQLLDKAKVKYLILEKVAFQSMEDFDVICILLKKNGVKAWVNCVRRLYPFYSWLLPRIDLSGPVSMEFDLGPSTGGDSGLGCNTIHALDIFSFLTKKQLFKIDKSGLDREIFQGRRVDFVEMSGYLIATTDKGDFLRINYRRLSKRPSSQIIWTDTGCYTVLDKELIYKEASDGWETKSKVYKEPLQSELTGPTVMQLLETGTSLLTGIEESSLHHKPMLEAFRDHINKTTGKNFVRCPIT